MTDQHGVGAEHLDERMPLAYVYDGDALRETLYHVKEIYQVRSGLLAPVEKIGENGVNIRVCR